MSEHVSHASGHHVSFDATEQSTETHEARRLLAARDVDGAIALLEPLTAGEVDDALVFELLGIAYSQKGSVNAAVGAMETAAQLNPASPFTHYNLGMVRLRSGDPSGAIEAFERSLRVDPTYGRAREAIRILMSHPTPEPAEDVPAGAQASVEHH